jgi:glyoxylase-like metal-dependent hydrolase (beta-lactamase superfamily II)
MLPKKIGIALGIVARVATACAIASAAAVAERTGAAKPLRNDADVARLLTGLCRPFRGSGVAVALQGQRFASEQARDPATAVATIDARQSMLILPRGSFLLRTSTIFPGGIEFRFKTVGSPLEELTIDEIGWRNGDILTRDTAASSARHYADQRMLVPALLACDALASKRSGDAATLRYRDGAGRMTSLHLSAMAIEGAHVGSEEYRYQGWRPTGSRLQPATIEQQRGKKVVARWTSVHAVAAHGKHPRLFNIRKNYRAPDDAGALRATPIGAGAYRVDGTSSGYHTGFVVGARGVAIFDAPVSVEDARLVRALIERTAPKLPIAYVILSHVHGDHIAGLPAYLDAEIITGAGAGVALRRQFPLPSHFRVREITEPTDIDLGGQIVNLFPLNSSHASTMLVGFAPASKGLFQGDLFYVPERGVVPPAFQTGLELKRVIAERKLDVRYIIGVHGRTGTTEDLEHAVRLGADRVNRRGGIGLIPH